MKRETESATLWISFELGKLAKSKLRLAHSEL